MDARARWTLGMQWGALAWLGWLVLQALRLGDGVRAGAGLAVLALVALGSRWARGAAATAILLEIAMGIAEAASYGAPVQPLFALRFFVPRCLPLLPLVALRIEEPRVTVALALVGRWREAARAGGAGVALVALSWLSLSRGLHAVLVQLHDGRGTLAPFALSAVLVAVAALAVRGAPARTHAA